MNRLTGFDWTVLTVVIIGAVNWGLIGFFNFDLVSAIFGEMSFVSRAIYAIVGLGGLYLIYGATRLEHKGAETMPSAVGSKA